MNLLDVEETVLGLCMKDPGNLADALARGLSSAHFSDPWRGRFFGAMVEAWGSAEPLDLPTVCNRLGREHAEEVSRIRRQAPVTRNFLPYLQGLLDTSRQMELQSKLVEISRDLAQRKPMQPIAPVLERLTELVAYAKDSGLALRSVTLNHAVQQSLKAAEERVEVKRVGVPSGFPGLDARTHGFQKGGIYVLGARTSVGKTTLAATIAVNAAAEGHKVAFVTVEMTSRDLADKMLSRAARVAMDRYLGADLDTDEIDRLHAATKWLAGLPVFLTEVFKPTIDHLAFEILRMVKIEGVELVIVDYLQLFETGDERTHRPAREEAKLVSARLKSLALQLQVPILVLSQLNRQAPEDGEPDLVHIAETDQIARDADVVLFLYRADGCYYLSIAKNRRGVKKAFRLKADLQHSLFEELVHAPR